MGGRGGRTGNMGMDDVDRDTRAWGKVGGDEERSTCGCRQQRRGNEDCKAELDNEPPPMEFWSCFCTRAAC